MNEFDWDSLRQNTATMNEQDLDRQLRETPVADLAAICYSKEEALYVVSPDNR